jgi:hypothetical protein
MFVFVLVVIGGCGGDPSCKEALTNAAVVLDLRASEITTEIGRCEQQSWSVEMRKCLANAKTGDALKGCKVDTVAMEKGSMKPARKSEALIQLNKISKQAIIEYLTNATFPTQAAPLTPAVNCCTQNDNGMRKCAAIAADWNTPEWRALDFSMEKDFLYQYSYTPGSDGTTFVAKAVGDINCDGKTLTFELHGFIVNGTPKTEIIEPPPNSE